VIEVALSPRPVRELGLTVKHGPIVAIREDSPAMRAGLQVDDLLVEIDGQPIGDPLSLTQRLTPKSSMPEEVTVTVERPLPGGKSERKSFQVTPEIPLRSLSLFPTNPISVEPLGIAFRLTDEVAAVAPGGPAAKAGLKKGDKLTRVDFLLGGDDATAEKLKSVHPQAGIDEIVFDDDGTWTEVVYQLQSIFPDSTVKLSWTRGDKAMSAAATPRDSQDFFDDSRGVQLYGLKVMHVAAHWGDAFALGFRETKEKLFQTLLILRRLVTFRLSPTNLSGPAGIIFAAGAFASQGLSDLLLFLVLLSANLAILNFLPIPALDGGHMLFLTAEAVRGKPVDEKIQMRLTMAGVLCLLSLMVFATAMDIGRFAQMFQRWFD
jgi:regulator of sigma E protease